MRYRRRRLTRMGVEQKPLFVTQVDKLEAKIQVRTLKNLNISNLNKFKPIYIDIYCIYANFL